MKIRWWQTKAEKIKEIIRCHEIWYEIRLDELKNATDFDKDEFIMLRSGVETLMNVSSTIKKLGL